MSTLQNTAPTTAQMKAALAAIHPVKAQRSAGSGMAEAVADSIAIGAAGTVQGVVDAGVGTINFLDRIKTGYQFKRAIDTGKIQLLTPATPAPRKAKATS